MELLHAYYQSRDYRKRLAATRLAMLLPPSLALVVAGTLLGYHSVPLLSVPLELAGLLLALLLLAPVGLVVLHLVDRRQREIRVTVDGRGIEIHGPGPQRMVTWETVREANILPEDRLGAPVVELVHDQGREHLSAFLTPTEILSSREMLLRPYPRWRLPGGQTEALDLRTSDLYRILRHHLPRLVP